METFDFQGYKIPVELTHLTGAGPDKFSDILAFHRSILMSWIGIEPHHSVLELGCGIGRDAIWLADLITTGNYTGIDIVKPSIDWCSQNITPRNRAFSFVHFDVKDQLHNKDGVTSTIDIRLPVASNSVDRIFAFSVFTHMFQGDIEHYLREFRRVLRPTGLVYATTFLFNDAILESARRTNLTPYDLRFEHPIGNGCRINDLAHPLGGVAYTHRKWDEMIARCGLAHAKPPLKGGWSGFYPEPQEAQDAVILRI